MLVEKEQLGRAASIHVLTDDEAAPSVGLGSRCLLRSYLMVLSRLHAASVLWSQDGANLPKHARVLLFLGRTTLKNIPSVISALAITESGPWHLVIAGPDQENHQRSLKLLTACRC